MNRWLPSSMRKTIAAEDEAAGDSLIFDLEKRLEADEVDEVDEVIAEDELEAEAAAQADNPPESQQPAATYFDATTFLEGTLHTDGNVGIEGTFEGEITSGAYVIVGRDAEVRANISAEAVVVAGKVVGNITARAGVEIQSAGRVVGNLTASELHIEPGGVLKGQTFTGSESDVAELTRPAHRSGSRQRRSERPAPESGAETNGERASDQD